MENNNNDSVATMENEKWVEARINGLTAELYEVSDQGRVRVKEHSITFMRKGKLSVRLCKAHLIKPGDNGLGYLQVRIMINGQSKAVLVHRLIMDSFNPDYDDSLTDINHCNSNRADNRLVNLDRLSHRDNLRQEHRLTQVRKPLSSVKVINQSNREQYSFNSISSAAGFIGISQPRLSQVLRTTNSINGFSVYFKD